MTSDHFDGKRFTNPAHAMAGQRFSSVPRMLREPRRPWPAWVEESPRVPAPRGDARVIVTFIGHATFLIQTAAANILTDPMYSDRAGPLNVFGPRRVRRPGVRFDQLPPIDVVLLSHNHYDHCDRATLRALSTFDPLVITPTGNASLVRACGIRRVEELDWWESARSSPLPVTVAPARHFSARTPFDRNRALWGSFYVMVDGMRLYFAGDSAYAPHFSDVRQRLGAPDLALIPIGAYEPRWFMHVVHMNPAEAVRAHVDLGARQSIGMHYGTFQLTAEGIDEPVRDLEAALEAGGVASTDFRTMAFGESVVFE